MLVICCSIILDFVVKNLINNHEDLSYIIQNFKMNQYLSNYFLFYFMRSHHRITITIWAVMLGLWYTTFYYKEMVCESVIDFQVLDSEYISFSNFACTMMLNEEKKRC